MDKRHIAYLGEKFTIEYYVDGRGKSIALDYFDSLPKERQKKVMSLFITMGDTGKIFNKEKFNYEDDQIYAFKPAPDRFLCFFFKGAKIIITNCFEKKTPKLPPREKDRALKYKEDYTKRVNGDDYYD